MSEKKYNHYEKWLMDLYHSDKEIALATGNPFRYMYYTYISQMVHSTASFKEVVEFLNLWHENQGFSHFIKDFKIEV